MKNSQIVLTTCILLIAAIAVTGCAVRVNPDGNPPTITQEAGKPVATMTVPQGVGVYRVDSRNNGETNAVGLGDIVQVTLAEDYSTGYTWNATTTPGLVILDDRYEPSQVIGPIAGGVGTRVWDLKAIQPGLQMFTAIYGRPGESLAGNETSYTVHIQAGGVSGPVFTERDNEKTVRMRMGDVFILFLHENPATGFRWHMSVSSGLTVTADRSFPGQRSSPVGAGGTHEWDVKVTGTGDQTIYGLYKRPDETTTGNEDTFMLTISVR